MRQPDTPSLKIKEIGTAEVLLVYFSELSWPLNLKALFEGSKESNPHRKSQFGAHSWA